MLAKVFQIRIRLQSLPEMYAAAEYWTKVTWHHSVLLSISKSLINIKYATLVSYFHVLRDKNTDKPFSHVYLNFNTGDSISYENWFF